MGTSFLLSALFFKDKRRQETKEKAHRKRRVFIFHFHIAERRPEEKKDQSKKRGPKAGKSDWSIFSAGLLLSPVLLFSRRAELFPPSYFLILFSSFLFENKMRQKIEGGRKQKDGGKKIVVCLCSSISLGLSFSCSFFSPFLFRDKERQREERGKTRKTAQRNGRAKEIINGDRRR